MKTTYLLQKFHTTALGWLACLTLFFCAAAQAQQIVISNFGVSANGMPYAVAMDKGFFRDEGINVTGILTSAGGGTSLRNMLAGGVPYGEVNPTAAIAAIQQGADIRIISDNVLTVAEFVWAVKPDSPIKTLADMKGRKIGYTNTRSTSQALAQMLIQKGGLKQGDVELVRTGGFGEGLTALSGGIVDVAPIPEPLWAQHKTRFRAIANAADMLPPLTNVVGVTTANMAAEKGDFIRAVIRARRKAIAFMTAKPDEAGEIVAKHYNLSKEVGIAAVRNLTTSRTQGLEYWGTGQFNMDGFRRMVDLQKSVGALSGDIDLGRMIDTQFLPEDLRKSR